VSCTRKQEKQRSRLVDNILHMIAGAIIALGFFSQEMFIPPIPRMYIPLCPPSIAGQFCWYPVVYTIARLPGYGTMAIGLAAAAIGVRTFFNERLVYWRETASGMNTFVYFMAKNIVDLVPIIIYAVSLTSAFVAVASPGGSFIGYLGTVVFYEFCLYSIGYICGCLSPSNPSILAVIVALVSGLGIQATYVPFMWSRWAGEAFLLTELDSEHQPLPVRVMVEEYIVYWKYKVGNYGQDILAMALIGAGLRLLAYVLMRILYRDKQR